MTYVRGHYTKRSYARAFDSVGTVQTSINDKNNGIKIKGRKEKRCLVDLPGTTATVFSARKTLKVLRAAKFPKGKAMVMYLQRSKG